MKGAVKNKALQCIKNNKHKVPYYLALVCQDLPSTDTHHVSPGVFIVWKKYYKYHTINLFLSMAFKLELLNSKVQHFYKLCMPEEPQFIDFFMNNRVNNEIANTKILKYFLCSVVERFCTICSFSTSIRNYKLKKLKQSIKVLFCWVGRAKYYQNKSCDS